MQIRSMESWDWQDFFQMSKDFYASPATLHDISEIQLRQLFNDMTSEMPFVKGLMLEEDGACAGYGVLVFSYSSEIPGLIVWIEELYISSDFRGCGLGTKFLNWVKDTYGEVASAIRLEVTESNTGAARLYTSLGYQPIDYKQYMLHLK